MVSQDRAEQPQGRPRDPVSVLAYMISSSSTNSSWSASGASSADFKFKPVRGGRRSGVHETQGHSYKMPNLHKLKDMQSKAEAMKSADSRLGAVGADESDEDE